jgi:hypothetical protein
MYRTTTEKKAARRKRLTRHLCPTKVRSRRTNYLKDSPIAGAARYNREVNYATVHYPHSLDAHLNDWGGIESEDTHAGEYDNQTRCIYGNPYCETCV